MRITNNEILMGLDPDDVYLLVLNKNVNGFPYHYWEEGNISIERANICIRFLVDKILKWDENQVYENFTYDTFYKNGLKGMVLKCFNDKFHFALESAFPGKYKPWLFKTAPRNYWTKETFLNALKWTIEEKLHLSKNDIPKVVSEQFMKDHSLITGFQKFFNSSPYEAIDALYPGVYQRFQFKKMPNGYWNPERTVDAVIWNCKKLHKPTIERVINNSTYGFAKNSKLECPLYKFFDGSVPKMIEAAYPNIYSTKNKNIQLKTLYPY